MLIIKNPNIKNPNPDHMHWMLSYKYFLSTKNQLRKMQSVGI